MLEEYNKEMLIQEKERAAGIIYGIEHNWIPPCKCSGIIHICFARYGEKII